MKKSFNALILVISVFASPSSFSHGEHAAGPHGGEIRMPGAFHTEVVQRNPAEFDVYLLDFNWKDPIIENSSVSASISSGRRKVDLTCVPSFPRFTCKAVKPFLGGKGAELTIKAMRKNAVGGLAVYKLPLKKFK